MHLKRSPRPLLYTVRPLLPRWKCIRSERFVNQGHGDLIRNHAGENESDISQIRSILRAVPESPGVIGAGAEIRQHFFLDLVHGNTPVFMCCFGWTFEVQKVYSSGSGIDAYGREALCDLHKL